MVAQYLRARAIVMAHEIERCEGSVAAWEGNHPGFAHIVRNELREQRDRARKVQIAADTGVFERGLSILRTASAGHQILNELVLPALMFEEEPERYLRHLFRRFAQDVGVTNISDAVVAVGRAWGTACLRGAPQFPAVYVPLYQEQSLIDLAFFAHELGHSVWRCNREELAAFEDLILAHYSPLMSVGPKLLSAQQKRRRQMLTDCVEYWDLDRLEEVFSDAFAAYVTGPAYAYAWVDYLARETRDPFEIVPGDEHPPAAFRMQVILGVLESQGASPLLNWVREFWNSLTATSEVGPKAGTPHYEFLCPNALASAFVKGVLPLLESQGIRGYVPPHVPPGSLKDPVPFPSLVNLAVQKLLFEHTSYGAWEQDALAQIKAWPVP